MNKSGRFFFNLISLLLGVGLVFFARPISSYASTIEYEGTLYRDFKSSSYSGTPTVGHKYSCYPSESAITLSLGSYSGVFSSTGEIYVVTTEGCYLAYSGTSTSSSVVCSRISSRSFIGYPIGLLGTMRSSYHRTTGYLSPISTNGTISSSFHVDDISNTDPDLVELEAIKQDTSDILAILNGFDLSTIENLVSLIEQHNASIQFSVDNIEDYTLSINSNLSQIAYMLLSIKKSVSYTFPSTIDGNYQLSHCFYNGVFSANNECFDLGYCAFDFSGLDSNLDFVVRVPDSRKMMFLSTSSSTDFLSLLSFVYNNGSAVSFTYEATNSFDAYTRCYIITFADSVPIGKYVKCTIYRNVNSFTGRCALYDYVVGANDILNYLEEQWEATKPGSSDLDDHNSDTGNLINDVNVIDTSVYTDFDSAYSGTGISGFDWSVFGGMIVFSSIVNNFWGALSSEFSLYIVAILIVGCAAVLLSAVARITKKGD